MEAKLGEADSGVESYQQAVPIYDKLHALLPDDNRWLEDKGKLLLSIASLQDDLKQSEEELGTLEHCIAVFDEMLERAPQHLGALKNKANALTRMAGLQPACENLSTRWRHCSKLLSFLTKLCNRHLTTLMYLA